MRILDWFRRKRHERDEQDRWVDDMRRVDEPREPHLPSEAYLSQLRD